MAQNKLLVGVVKHLVTAHQQLHDKHRRSAQGLKDVRDRVRDLQREHSSTSLQVAALHSLANQQPRPNAPVQRPGVENAHVEVFNSLPWPFDSNVAVEDCFRDQTLVALLRSECLELKIEADEQDPKGFLNRVRSSALTCRWLFSLCPIPHSTCHTNFFPLAANYFCP